uniref:Putative monooxygenase p33MONOX n=1 Tax=Nothobranchius pienaari TaxID=704102 RepID=A0A1A8QUH0_9TELE
MRHNISYDEHIDIPMHSPPADMTVNVFWKDHPIVPQHRFRNTVEKSSTMDGTNPQINLKVEDPAQFMAPKIEISGVDPKRVSPRPHKLKPRDMNVLTPSGF